MRTSGADDVAPTAPGRLARQTLDRCGGPVGLAAAITPTASFVVANAIGGLTPALIVLGVTASAVLGLRIARRESVRAAVGGAVLAAVYALLAALTGQARAFFLVPTLLPGALALVCLVSAGLRRPITGLLFNRVVDGPAGWPRHRRLRRVYTLSTLAAALVNTVNFAAQAGLYLDDRPAALAVVHFAVWPVFAGLVATTMLAARRVVTGTTARRAT